MSKLKFKVGDRVKWTCPEYNSILYHTGYLKGQSFIGTVFECRGRQRYHIIFDVENKCFHPEYVNGVWVDADRCYIVEEKDLSFCERLEINSDNPDTIFIKAKDIIKAESEKAAAADFEKVYQEKLKATKFKFKPGDFVVVTDSGYTYSTYDSWHGFAEAGVSNTRYRPDPREGNIYKVIHCSSRTKIDFTRKLVLLSDGYGKLYIIGEDGCDLA